MLMSMKHRLGSLANFLMHGSVKLDSRNRSFIWLAGGPINPARRSDGQALKISQNKILSPDRIPLYPEGKG